MRPRIDLSGAILRANVRAYAALGIPVAAVVKNDAYGWGVARVVREIDDVVESYVVADEAEFWALRMRTRRRIRLLAAVPPARLAAVCAADGVPNVATLAGLDAAAAYAERAARPADIRVGIIDAAGWTGIAAADAGAFAEQCSRRDLHVELWTHVTSPARRVTALADFAAAAAAFRAAGVSLAGIDVASTAGATSGSGGDRVRIGAGLFGARLGGTVGTACAVRVEAPLVEWFAPGAIAYAGYGEIDVPANRGVAVLRCGYGDGFPKNLAGDDDILSVGMQYTTRLSNKPMGGVALIDAQSDLDDLANRAGIGPHELLTGLARLT